MEISIGIMAYNEENSIADLLDALLSQKTAADIKEIIVVSSGSTDRTDRIVREYSEKYGRIRLITEKSRKGKSSAINEFLGAAKSGILVLESADTVPEDGAIEALCRPLKDEKIGITAARPVPRGDKKGIIGFLVGLQWMLHHKVSLSAPKFGELIAFRNVIWEIGNTACDEEYIAMLIKEKHFHSAYAAGSIVYNTGPKTLSDFLKQRRRIYCGHLELKKKNGYEAPTLSNLYVLRLLLGELRPWNLFRIPVAALLEGYARLLGTFDFYAGKKHYVWDISETTKK